MKKSLLIILGIDPAYPVFVSKVDEDGNELAGVRLPAVEAPIATTTGWALRRDGFGENDGCESDGQQIPFATTKAERIAAGDPRLSIEERYKDHDGYVKAVAKAAKNLGKQRFLLSDDVYQNRPSGARQVPVLPQMKPPTHCSDEVHVVKQPPSGPQR